MPSQLGLLGEVEFIDAQSERAPLVRPNQRRLIAVIGTYYRQPVASEWLAELLELTPGGLRTRIRRIRQIVGDDAVVTQASGYRLGDVSIDVEDFEQRRQAAAELDERERIEALGSALGLWRGEALVEFAHEPWAAGEAARLNELRSTVEDEVATGLITIGRHAEAVAALEGQVARNPFRDKSRRLVMVALASDGRHAEALRAFQDYREFLIDETGTEPPDETKHLEQLILTGELDEYLQRESTPSPVALTPGEKASVLTLVTTEISMPTGSPELIEAIRDQQDLLVESAALQVDAHQTGFTSAFVDPVDAVEYASSLQRHRSASFEETSGEFGLAIGIHSGLGYENDGGYRRATVDSAQSVAQAARPGQILLSSAAAELVAQHNDFRLLPRGSHRLHTGATAELIELLWSDSPLSSGRLRTITDVPTNISAVRPTLIGRSVEIKSIGELLEDHRLLTIVGPGGAGKSALAIEAAAGQRHNYPDGVFVVELAAMTDPLLLANTVAKAIGLRAEPAGHTVASLADALRHQKILIVIDNAELLLDAVADLAQTVLAVHGPTLITTSREWLDVPGEKTYHLPTLTSRGSSGRTYAAELFLANASAAGVSVGGFDDDIVERLCERLDHLPLALELAAGSAMHLTPTQIIGSLERGERLRSTRRRNRVRRFTSVDEMLEGSFELLDVHQRSLLLTLSVFRGPTELDAIAGIWKSPAVTNAAEAIGSLVVRSLAVATSDGDGVRYHLLETVRDFARDRAQATDTFEDLQRAHRDWFLQWSAAPSLLEQFGSTRRARAFEAQLANLREAMTFSETHGDLAHVRRQAVQLSSLWFTFMHGDEGLRWFRVGAETATETADRLLYLMGALTASFASEQWDDVLEMTTELGTLSESSELPEAVLGMAVFGITHVINLDIGMKALNAARDREAKLHAGVMPIIDHLSGDLLLYSGNYDNALDRYQRSTASIDLEEYAWVTSSGLVGIGLCLHARGKTEAGVAQVDRSLDIARGMPESLGGITRGVVVRSVLQSAMGQTSEARSVLSAEVERNERRTRLATVRAEPLAGVVHLAIDTGDIGFAHAMLTVILGLGMQYRSPWQHVLCDMATKRLAEHGELPDPAPATIDDALQQSRRFLDAGESHP